MSKLIQGFRYRDYAIFLDQSDGGKVTVGVNDGNILLFEGLTGFHGVCVPPSDFGGFRLEHQDDGDWSVILEFADGLRHLLGQTPDLQAARTWVSRASELISKHQSALQSFVIQSITTAPAKPKPRRSPTTRRSTGQRTRKVAV